MVEETFPPRRTSTMTPGRIDGQQCTKLARHAGGFAPDWCGARISSDFVGHAALCPTYDWEFVPVDPLRSIHPLKIPEFATP